MNGAARRIAGKRGASIGSAGGAIAALAATAVMSVATLVPAPGLAQSGREWEHDWVVLTVARNGAWGKAVSGSLMRAMVQAISECRRKSGTSGDCGAEITTVRASWSLAYACGEYTFIATGDTSAEARAAAIHRAIDLKEILRIELAPCNLLVGVGPDGAEAPRNALSEILPVVGTDR